MNKYRFNAKPEFSEDNNVINHAIVLLKILPKKMCAQGLCVSITRLTAHILTAPNLNYFLSRKWYIPSNILEFATKEQCLDKIRSLPCYHILFCEDEDHCFLIFKLRKMHVAYLLDSDYGNVIQLDLRNITNLEKMVVIKNNDLPKTCKRGFDYFNFEDGVMVMRYHGMIAATHLYRNPTDLNKLLIRDDCEIFKPIFEQITSRMVFDVINYQGA